MPIVADLTEWVADVEAAAALPGDRARTAAVLLSVMDLLEQVDAPKAQQRIAHLVTALVDLDRGVVDPILERGGDLENRARDPHAVWRSRIVLAVAVDILCFGGHGLDDACRQVARLAPEFKNLRRGRGKNEGTDADTLKGWRTRLQQGRAIPQEFVDAYKASRTTAEAHGSKDKERARKMAREWIEAARNAAGGTIPSF